jgi:hypothetical protein
LLALDIGTAHLPKTIHRDDKINLIILR